MGFHRRHRHDHYDDDHHGGMFTGVRLFHGPMRFRFFGRPVIVSTFAIVGNLKTSSQDKNYYSTELEQIKADAAPYLDIINRAKNNTLPGNADYDIKYAEFERVNYGSGSDTGYKASSEYVGYYTVVYKINILGTEFTGETISLYISKTNVPDPLEIAYQITGYDEDFNPTGVKAVEVDFKNIYESEVSYYEAELEEAKSLFKTSLCGVIILGVIIAIIIAIIILLIVKVIKKSKQEAAFEKAKKEAEVKEAEARAQEAEAMAMQAEARLNLQRRYCEYCEAKFPDGDNKCPNCGSTHFIIKK